MNESEILACAGKIAAFASDPQNIVPQDEWDYEGLPSPEWHRAEMMNGSLEMAGEAAKGAVECLEEGDEALALELLKDAEAAYAEYHWFRDASSEAVGRHLADWYGNS